MIEVVIRREGDSVIVNPAVEQWLLTQLKDGEMLAGELKRSKSKQRTIPQNASIHLFCEHIAQTLNDSGYDQRQALEAFNGVELENTMESVKETIFKRIMRILTGKTSTTELETDEVDIVQRNVNTLLGRLDVYVPFPDKFTKGLE